MAIKTNTERFKIISNKNKVSTKTQYCIEHRYIRISDVKRTSMIRCSFNQRKLRLCSIDQYLNQR